MFPNAEIQLSHPNRNQLLGGSKATAAYRSMFLTLLRYGRLHIRASLSIRSPQKSFRATALCNCTLVREMALTRFTFLYCRMCFSAVLLMANGAAASAGDPALQAPVPLASPSGPETLTGDWFGQGPALRNAGFDFRLEWSQFYQGMTRGEGDKTWQYGGKIDALARVDLAKLGFWEGLSVTAQYNFNYGHSVNGVGGTIGQVNTALAFPGIEGADRSDIMALYVTQRFGDLVSVSLGKLNMLEIVRARPLQGGIGTDTFWNVNLGPITGVTPPTLNGAQIIIRTEPVSYVLMIYDPLDATNRPLFSDLFHNGVTFNGSATLRTSIAGLTGYYGIKGIYSTRRGTDFSEIIVPPGTDPGTKKGSWLAGFSFQQYLVQDPSNPARGWGVFGEIDKGDGNPNLMEWTGFIGRGGSSLIPGRPDDRFGIAYFRLGVSNALKDELAPIFKLKDESGVEVFYNFAVTPWFRITGDVQFIRPGSANSPRSIFVGLGSYIRF
jgi:porin